ncbi:MAG: glutamate racemase [Bacteroidota bacterium]
MKHRANQAIGIFDSGIGGLTVANAISKHLPQEELIYFGDTANMPYGDKSKDLIKSYALEITNFLLNEKKCKAIVIACNTASAAAYEYLRDVNKGETPIINVIDPIVEAVIADNAIHKVGLIATKTTVDSGVYQEKIARRKPSLLQVAMPTPLLAKMIEEGFYNDQISHAVIEKYLNDVTLDGIDALILGCTHYVLIRDEINLHYNNQIKLFDSTDIVALKLKGILENEDLLNNKRKNENVFYISDMTENFRESAKMFYGENINLELYKIWNKLK